jgi:hypothetical protein
MDLWGPKHVELANAVNVVNHIKKTLCVVLDYIYITMRNLSTFLKIKKPNV